MERFARILMLTLVSLTVATPAVADAVVVDGSEIQAKNTDGTPTASVTVFNVSDAQVSLEREAMSPPNCVTDVQPSILPRGRSSEVTVTLKPSCVTEPLLLDLDGSGQIPAIIVKPAAARHDWGSTRTGLEAGFFLAIVSLLAGWLALREASTRATSPKAKMSRDAAYTMVQRIVNTRFSSLGTHPAPSWKPRVPSKLGDHGLTWRFAWGHAVWGV